MKIIGKISGAVLLSLALFSLLGFNALALEGTWIAEPGCFQGAVTRIKFQDNAYIATEDRFENVHCNGTASESIEFRGTFALSGPVESNSNIGALDLKVASIQLTFRPSTPDEIETFKKTTQAKYKKNCNLSIEPNKPMEVAGVTCNEGYGEKSTYPAKGTTLYNGFLIRDGKLSLSWHLDLESDFITTAQDRLLKLFDRDFYPDAAVQQNPTMFDLSQTDKVAWLEGRWKTDEKTDMTIEIQLKTNIVYEETTVVVDPAMTREIPKGTRCRIRLKATDLAINRCMSLVQDCREGEVFLRYSTNMGELEILKDRDNSQACEAFKDYLSKKSQDILAREVLVGVLQEKDGALRYDDTRFLKIMSAPAIAP